MMAQESEKPKSLSKIGIAGAGAFGTSLAIAIQQEDRNISLWARRLDAVQIMRSKRENVERLPGIKIPQSIDITNDLQDIASCDLVLYVGPAQQFRSFYTEFHKQLPTKTPVVICAKGIEQSSGKLLSVIATEIAPQHPIAVLSGPGFANDIAANLPTALTLACENESLGQTLCNAIGNRSLRPYWTPDLVGAQVGGSLKNVIAIACGIVHGKQLGESARTALMTRGLAEIARLASVLGGDPTTLMGLSGIGDLALTCNSLQSRNMSFGQKLGQGVSVNDILRNRAAVTEGVTTAKAIYQLTEKHKLDMPISAAVYAVIYENMAIDDAIDLLLTRPYKREN